MISAQFGILTRWQYSHNTTKTSQCRPLGVFAVHIIKPDDTEEINYIHKDHLGSWHTITDERGNLIQELSFDAWGNRRYPATWRAFAGTPPEPLFDRGFTGHEHLYAVNLINMNGRVYDPIVSRMLSPDNFIQAPGFSQSLNRYSYCWNNPLKYTDPSGNELGVENRNNWFWWEYRGGSNSSHSIGPGSGDHWSDQYRSEYGNFMLGNHASFDGIYGNGAFELALEVVADKDALRNWSRGTSSLTEGIWVNIPNKNIEGIFRWYGTASTRNELTSYEVINKFVKFGMDLGQDGGGGLSINGITSQEAAYGITALGLSISVKTELFRFLEGSKNLPSYFKGASKFGMRLGFVGLGVTTIDGFTNTNGWQNHHTADLMVQGSVLTIAAFVPVAGWVVAGGYFAGDLIFQYYHDGQGITEYYFDKP